jgi:hypothetical protein
VAGQDKIARSDAVVRVGGLAGEVAVRYLAGAGFRRLRVPDVDLVRAAQAVDPEVVVQVSSGPSPDDGEDPRDFLQELGVRDHSAGEVATGAHVALVTLRAALGREP